MDRSPPESEPQLRLPESSSLVVLLVFFAGIALISLISIVASEDVPGHSQMMPDRAYGPEDVTGVDFDFEPLPGLTGESSAPYTLPPPPFSDPDIFPCSSCHEEGDYDATRRELGFHEEIQLNHGPRDRWCFDCHNPEQRDVLRLSSGRTVTFEESYELCGQCHGTIFRDWKQGIHGRRRGYWNGAKSYLLCAHCHNPHSPRPAPIKPLPPPIHPSYLASDLGRSAEGSTHDE
ncbi:MAG: cytochrome c3 family protein [Acidobacteriota bacterium]|nr:cytochrome c3 family protein [Acidobacteriota bacterium]